MMKTGNQVVRRLTGVIALFGWMPLVMARSLVWTGAVDNSFDATTANWVVEGTSDATAFAK